MKLHALSLGLTRSHGNSLVVREIKSLSLYIYMCVYVCVCVCWLVVNRDGSIYVCCCIVHYNPQQPKKAQLGSLIDIESYTTHRPNIIH